MKQEAYKHLFSSAILDAPNFKPMVISLVGGGGKTSCAFWLAKQFQNQGHTVFISTTTKMYLPEENQANHFISTQNNPFGKIKEKCNLVSRESITFAYKETIPNNNKNTKNKVIGITSELIDKLKNDSPFTVFIIEADGAKHLPIKAPNRHEPCIPKSTDMIIGVIGAEVIHAQANPEIIHRWETFAALTQCNNGDLIDQNILRKLIEHPEGMFKNAPTQTTRVWLINKIDLVHCYQDVVEFAKAVLVMSTKLDAVWLASMKNQASIKEVLIREPS